MSGAWDDWRLSVLATCLFWGLWVFLGKVSAVKVGWPATALLGWGLGMSVLIPLTLPHFRWPGWPDAWWAIAFGVAGALGEIFFVRALERGPASLVAPLAEGYLIVTVLLALIFLGESLTWRRGLGIVLMMAGAFLLARSET